MGRSGKHEVPLTNLQINPRTKLLIEILIRNFDQIGKFVRTIMLKPKTKKIKVVNKSKAVTLKICFA